MHTICTSCIVLNKQFILYGINNAIDMQIVTDQFINLIDISSTVKWQLRVSHLIIILSRILNKYEKLAIKKDNLVVKKNEIIQIDAFNHRSLRLACLINVYPFIMKTPEVQPLMLQKWFFSLLLTMNAIIIKVNSMKHWSPRRNQYYSFGKAENILLSLAFRNTMALK